MHLPTSPNQNSDTIARRMRAMFRMHETGVDMLRCRLRREYPQETREQIAKRVSAVLRKSRYDPAVYEERRCSRFSAES